MTYENKIYEIVGIYNSRIPSCYSGCIAFLFISTLIFAFIEKFF